MIFCLYMIGRIIAANTLMLSVTYGSPCAPVMVFGGYIVNVLSLGRERRICERRGIRGRSVLGTGRRCFYDRRRIDRLGLDMRADPSADAGSCDR